MNKIRNILVAIAGLLVIAGFTFAGKKDNAGGTPSISFETKEWDFGTIKNDRPATHSFKFTNTGTSNLVILTATAECGCTRPEFSEKPIAPGKTGTIKVSYNPIGRPGSFEKTVTVKTNGKPKTVRLKIRGTVAP